tara:strand:- start:76 stop:603 length:528 start_codon:yes stop_codon:yes gene_type:complete
MEHLSIPSNITFKDFKNKYDIELVFTTYCLNSQKLEILDYKNKPDLKILDGLCMSIAVPFLFMPVKYKNELYVDAFMVSIHPLDLSITDNSISICLESDKEYIDNIDLYKYIKIIVKSPIVKLQCMYIKNYKGRNIKIKCNYNFDAGFDITNETLNDFYKVGYESIVKETSIINY